MDVFLKNMYDRDAGYKMHLAIEKAAKVIFASSTNEHLMSEEAGVRFYQLFLEKFRVYTREKDAWAYASLQMSVDMYLELLRKTGKFQELRQLGFLSGWAVFKIADSVKGQGYPGTNSTVITKALRNNVQPLIAVTESEALSKGVDVGRMKAFV